MAELNIVRDTLVEELECNVRSRCVYEQERAELPKGSVTVRMRGNRAYCYLKFREGAHTITKYVGAADLVEDDLRSQIARRKELESVIKRLKHEEQFIEKALRHS